MINREATIRWKGYDPDKLKPNSHKKVWAICNNCGNGRWIIFQAYRDICHLCNQKINNPFKGKKHTKETLIKMSEIKRGKTSPRKGVKLSKETKKKDKYFFKRKMVR